MEILVGDKHSQYNVAKQFNDISTPPHNHLLINGNKNIKKNQMKINRFAFT